jgi:hypothetical protein
MTRLTIAALSLALLSATAANAGSLTPMADAYRSGAGTYGSHPRSPSMSPPRPPAPPAAPGYRPAADNGGAFKPWKPSMRVDSTRGGVDAYPGAKKPKGYIGPY